MKDYANQNWREADPEIERENGFAAICTISSFLCGVVFAAWWLA